MDELDEQLALLKLKKRKLELQSQQANASKSGFQKAYDIADVPHQAALKASKAVSGLVPSPEPTGNLPMDVLKGTPRIAAETAGEYAAGYLSPESLATMGAAKLAGPVLKAAGRGLSQVGKLSGATAEGLQEMASNPGVIFSNAKKAGKMIDEGVDLAKGGLDLGRIKEPMKLIETAEALAERGKLTPGAAQRATEEVNRKFGAAGLTREAQERLEQLFKKTANEDLLIKEGRKGYKTGKLAERLRSPFPLTKKGEPRQYLTGAVLSSALYNPAVTAIGAGLTSPLLQALAAGGLGAAGRAVSSPALTGSVANLAQALRGPKKPKKEGK